MDNAIEMETIAQNEALSDFEKLERLKNAKGGTWYDRWKPYCCQTITPCKSRLNRMEEMSYGFRCKYCGNMVGWNLSRLKESSLNTFTKKNTINNENTK